MLHNNGWENWPLFFLFFLPIFNYPFRADSLHFHKILYFIMSFCHALSQLAFSYYVSTVSFCIISPYRQATRGRLEQDVAYLGKVIIMYILPAGTGFPPPEIIIHIFLIYTVVLTGATDFFLFDLFPFIFRPYTEIQIYF